MCEFHGAMLKGPYNLDAHKMAFPHAARWIETLCTSISTGISEHVKAFNLRKKNPLVCSYQRRIKSVNSMSHTILVRIVKVQTIISKKQIVRHNQSFTGTSLANKSHQKIGKQNTNAGSIASKYRYSWSFLLWMSTIYSLHSVNTTYFVFPKTSKDFT